MSYHAGREKFAVIAEGHTPANTSGVIDLAPDFKVPAHTLKAIAIAILQNDLRLYSLGFSRPYSETCHALRVQKKGERYANECGKQLNLYRSCGPGE